MDINRINANITALQIATEKANQYLARANEKTPFKIVLCGAFSTGKTSLINALLGCELPTGLRPITKVVTCIRYGSRRKIFLEDTIQGTSICISDQKASNIILNQEKNSEFNNYRICYEIPSDLLKRGVEFMDTPGFEDDAKEKLDSVTKAAIREADFCIVIFASNSFGTLNERKFLEELQELTHGNYTCVINCINRIHSQGQMDDLKKHASTILAECGNEIVGIGKYFMVDSDRDSEEKYLDDLDTWIEQKLLRNFHLVRREAALSRGLAIISPAVNKGNALIMELFAQQNACILASEKYKISQCHKVALSNSTIPQKLSTIKRRFFDRLDQTFCEELRKKLETIDDYNYNDEAPKTITNMILVYSNNLENDMKQTFKDMDIMNPWVYISKMTYIWTKRDTWTTRKSLTEYMSDGLNYGIWKWDESHSNAFVSETIKDMQNTNISKIKALISEYFTLMEKKLVARECFRILSVTDKEQVEFDTQLDKLADKLIVADLLQSRIINMYAN